MSKKKRITALVLMILFVFITLFMTIFIAEEANHECIGDNCQICRQINFCENILKNISSGTAASAVISACFLFLYGVILPHCRNFCINTLVTLKVKLSN